MNLPSNHFDAEGQAHMVDVSAKPNTVRIATAEAAIRMLPQTAEMIRSGSAKKGDVLGIARIAAIGAVKSTSTLIPLCHAIPIEGVQVEFEHAWADKIVCRVTVKTTGRTGVEMEALTGASVACLTIYDMCKSVDRAMTIQDLRLLQKSGGASGDYVATVVAS